MTPTTCNFEIGDLYIFKAYDERHLWGIFSHRDHNNQIILEVCTDDFQTYHTCMPLPAHFTQAEVAPRSDLRDFAYQMGLQRV